MSNVDLIWAVWLADGQSGGRRGRDRGAHLAGRGRVHRAGRQEGPDTSAIALTAQPLAYRVKCQKLTSSVVTCRRPVRRLMWQRQRSTPGRARSSTLSWTTGSDAPGAAFAAQTQAHHARAPCTSEADCKRVCLQTASPEADAAETEEYTWQGADEYTELDDRKDLTPLALPSLPSPKRIVLVRHGQSTWNAEGRIQGSCNVSRLTDKGKAQAETTGDLVRLVGRFDFASRVPRVAISIAVM